MTTRAEFFNLHNPPVPVFRTNKELKVTSYQWFCGGSPHTNKAEITIPEGTLIVRNGYSQLDDGYSMSPFDNKSIPDLKAMKNRDRKNRWFRVAYNEMDFDHFEHPNAYEIG